MASLAALGGSRDLELRIGDRFRRAGLQQVLGLVLQMAETGTVGK
jgi:hypothetical protein